MTSFFGQVSRYRCKDAKSYLGPRYFDHLYWEGENFLRPHLTPKPEVTELKFWSRVMTSSAKLLFDQNKFNLAMTSLVA